MSATQYFVKFYGAMEALAKEPLALRRTRFKLVVDYALLEIVPRLRELGYTDIETFATETPVAAMHARLNALAAGRGETSPVVLVTRNGEAFDAIDERRNEALYVALWANGQYPIAKYPAKIDILIQHKAARLYGGTSWDLAIVK